MHIYNSISKQKELLTPLIPGEIRLYVCGVTVYDYCHIGHARIFLVFDMVYRYLRSRGLDVHYVRNITDIDDKIIQKAYQNKEDIQTVTERYIEAMYIDLATLNVLTPTQEPKATQSIDAMVEMIQTLLDKEYAYITQEGDVYFSVKRFKSYGALSHQTLEELHSGARVEVVAEKQDPLDFVLWKHASDAPHWLAPWGSGRPGWHIECSAMSKTCLGETIDIHGGGHDLKFPHHENERAQSEASNGRPFVKTWMHVGFVQIDKEKMSKSLGNFLTIKAFLEQFDGEVLRYFMLSSHYRSPVEYSDDSIHMANAALDRLYNALRGLSLTQKPSNSRFETLFHEAMQDDFNTPEALAVLFELSKEVNRLKVSHIDEANAMGALLKELATLLGLLYQDPEIYFQKSNVLDTLDSHAIEQLIQAREMARNNREWAKADEIRDQLLQKGVTLEDTSQGTLWRRKKN